jgi:hypothetical protein
MRLMAQHSSGSAPRRSNAREAQAAALHCSKNSTVGWSDVSPITGAICRSTLTFVTMTLVGVWGCGLSGASMDRNGRRLARLQRLLIITFMMLSGICAAFDPVLAQAPPVPGPSPAPLPSPAIPTPTPTPTPPGAGPAMPTPTPSGAGVCRNQFSGPNCKCLLAGTCAVTDCFVFNQAQWPGSTPATGPGAVGAAGGLVGGGPGTTPNVATTSGIPREPVTVGQDTCKSTFAALQQADQIIANMGLTNWHQDQAAAMSCLQDFCRKHQWPVP